MDFRNPIKTNVVNVPIAMLPILFRRCNPSTSNWMSTAIQIQPRIVNKRIKANVVPEFLKESVLVTLEESNSCGDWYGLFSWMFMPRNHLNQRWVGLRRRQPSRQFAFPNKRPTFCLNWNVPGWNCQNCISTASGTSSLAHVIARISTMRNSGS
jgi:hypothetical protein